METATQKIKIPCPTVYAERKTYYAGSMEPVITHDVPCGGTLRPCPVCKAVRFCGREGQCLDAAGAAHVVKRRFVIEDIDYGFPGGVPGWTRGETWNGWKCPRFEKAAALAILAQQAEFGGREEYDAATDTMRIWLDGCDAPDEYPGRVMETPEGPKTVYDIGAWAWCWDYADDEQQQQQEGAK
ncbi:MAG TPA: hypothetical protein VNS88_05855 [Nitrospiraceae bacterium]|nr:hypothetical protein [Nitrospiraceae bacterium]